VASRQLISFVASRLAVLPDDMHKEIAQYTLEAVNARAVVYEDEITVLRENLAEVFEREEKWSEAARTLAAIPLESGMRVQPNDVKLRKYVKIAQLYLEDDDAVSAESFINRASALISASSDEKVNLHYKVSYARVLDAKRKFYDAAVRYYELSKLEKRLYGSQLIEDQELIQALGYAITCAILTPAGPLRSRLLAMLYKDERSKHLSIFATLEAVHLNRLLRKDQVEAVAATMRPHQLAESSDGSNALDRAVTEHNLVAVSKLYTNIRIEELGNLLQISKERAERVAALMIGSNRLQGTIDQVDGVLEFSHSQRQEIDLWDRRILCLCEKLDDCSETIKSVFGELPG